MQKSLVLTQIELVGIAQKLRQVEELGNELFDVGHVVFGRRRPGLLDGVKHTVCQIEMPALQSQEVLSERLLAH